LRLKFCGSQPGASGEREEVFSYHPVVRTHPETGRKALYLGHPGDSVTSFEDMTDEESLPLLRYLFALASQPDFVYRHQWHPGDVVMWDNRCVLHYAVHDYGDAPRVLNRITIEGDEPR
jgi:taurine dioxygenase